MIMVPTTAIPLLMLAGLTANSHLVAMVLLMLENNVMTETTLTKTDAHAAEAIVVTESDKAAKTAMTEAQIPTLSETDVD